MKTTTFSRLIARFNVIAVGLWKALPGRNDKEAMRNSIHLLATVAVSGCLAAAIGKSPTTVAAEDAGVCGKDRRCE